MSDQLHKHIHFLGIGGVGMAGLAYLLKQRGYEVSGCDKQSTPRTQWLESSGISVFIGHNPSHLKNANELVITPAVPPTEPEFVAAQASGLSIRRRGEVLAELVNATDGIAVCGTHGKTTTATFTAKLLHLLGDDPGWCIGGECGDMPVAAIGKGPLVVEADESDGTLALYKAHTLIVTTVDYDHPEHFKTIDDYRACFAQAETQANDVIHAWELDASTWPELEGLVLGQHNVMNARAAIEVALRRGHSREQIAAVLPHALSSLPDRRFQTIWPPSPSTSNSQLPTPNSQLPTHKLTTHNSHLLIFRHCNYRLCPSSSRTGMCSGHGGKIASQAIACSVPATPLFAHKGSQRRISCGICRRRRSRADSSLPRL